MSAQILSGPAVVGQWYMVPCVKVDTSARSIWMDVNGWVPVLGPKHRDVEHLNFDHDHYHIDWRFVGHTAYRYACDTRGKSPLSRVLTNTNGRHQLDRAPELRRIKCKREMPEFPVVDKAIVAADGYGANRWEHLERGQAFTCNKLKPGNICPHRGIDLTPFVKPDGTVICPGHGLRWDTTTGDLLPHQGSAW